MAMDPEGGLALTPNHLLILRSGNYLVGVFDRQDNFVRRKWQQVQYLSEYFLKHWRREYLQTLQSRQKWHQVEPNFTVDDLVLVCDEFAHGKWPSSRAIQTYQDDLGHVRKVLVRTRNRALKRPITKLCKLASDVKASKMFHIDSFLQKNRQYVSSIFIVVSNCKLRIGL